MANCSNILPGVTFGIELEFIAVFPREFFLDFIEEGDNPDAVTGISRALSADGIPSTGHESLEDDEEINSNAESYSMWNVAEEGGLRLSDSERIAWRLEVASTECRIESVEVSSRKLRISEDWQSEVARVLQNLKDLADAGCRFITNASTGLHVHIALGDQRMPLRTVKNVLQLCTAFERRLDNLYPTNRIDPDNAYKRSAPSHFNANLSWHFGSNKHTNFARNICHWLSAIEECSTYEELGKFFKNDLVNVNSNGEANVHHTNFHFSTLNLENLYSNHTDDEAEPTGTIEFRQHDGTLDFKEISAHVLFKALLVSFCHTTSDIDFLKLCSQASNPEFQLFDFFAAIGMNGELLDHYKQRFSAENVDRKNAEFMQNIAKLQDEDSVFDLEVLQAQSEAEKHTRNTPIAVAQKIEEKANMGAYPDLNMRPFDIEGEYMKFVHLNGPAIQDAEKLSNLARTMVFQQLNDSQPFQYWA